MRKEETEGVAGRQADGTSRTREAKLAVIDTAGGRDPETGSPRPSPRAWTARPGGGACTTPGSSWSSPTGRSGYAAPARSCSAAGRSPSCSTSSTASSTPPPPWGRSCRPGRSGSGGSRRSGPTSRPAGQARSSGSLSRSAPGTVRSPRAAGIFAGTWSECAPTSSGRGASRSEAGSWKADAARSGCGSSAPAPAGQGGAPTPCWR